MSIQSPVLPSLLLIPTGIGCPIGGYAGDAIPSARILAAATGCLITHPNVMNAASLYWNDNRIQYVEGYGIDLFTSGMIYLQPVRQQKIGLLFDRGIDNQLRERHMQVANACYASLGLDIGPVVTTEKSLGVFLRQGPSGSSWGGVEYPDCLLKAGEKLKDAGATAVAVVTKFPEENNIASVESYRMGKGVDPLSGAEAVISHLMVKHLSIPCAHAPAMSSLPISYNLDPRTMAEEIGYTFLPSVLVGLSRAPNLVPVDKVIHTRRGLYNDLLGIEDLGAVIAPQGALGGASVLACIEKDVPVIVVLNKGVLDVDVEALCIEDIALNGQRPVLIASSYFEAAGLLLGLREGISISSLRRPIAPIV